MKLYNFNMCCIYGVKEIPEAEILHLNYYLLIPCYSFQWSWDHVHDGWDAYTEIKFWSHV